MEEAHRHQNPHQLTPGKPETGAAGLLTGSRSTDAQGWALLQGLLTRRSCDSCRQSRSESAAKRPLGYLLQRPLARQAGTPLRPSIRGRAGGWLRADRQHGRPDPPVVGPSSDPGPAVGTVGPRALGRGGKGGVEAGRMNSCPRPEAGGAESHGGLSAPAACGLRSRGGRCRERGRGHVIKTQPRLRGRGSRDRSPQPWPPVCTPGGHPATRLRPGPQQRSGSALRGLMRALPSLQGPAEPGTRGPPSTRHRRWP